LKKTSAIMTAAAMTRPQSITRPSKWMGKACTGPQGRSSRGFSAIAWSERAKIFPFEDDLLLRQDVMPSTLAGETALRWRFHSYDDNPIIPCAQSSLQQPPADYSENRRALDELVCADSRRLPGRGRKTPADSAYLTVLRISAASDRTVSTSAAPNFSRARA